MSVHSQPLADTDQRGAARAPLGREGTARDTRHQPMDVVIDDISATGCMLHSDAGFPVNQVLNLGIAGVGRREGRVVWAAGGKHGIQFLWPLTAAELEGAKTAESLVLGGFPQRLDALLVPEVPRETIKRVGAVAIATIASASLALWSGLYFGVHYFVG